MAETPTTTSSEPRTPPSSASEQARIRKERREAKIRAGGSARLDKITGLGGGIPRDAPARTPTASAAVAEPAAADPDEIDISQHFYEPPRRAQPAQDLDDAKLRQMMLGFDAASPAGPNPFGPPPPNAFAGPPGAPGADDPMMQMLQQMMGGTGGMPGMPGMAGVEAEPAAGRYAYIWRVVHGVFAVGLGLYVALVTGFTGSRTVREGLVEEGAAAVRFFWIFATAEVVLQTSRFFVEGGRVQQGAMMGMVSGFLPEPWKGYLALVTRYSRIWTTVSGDALALVFVLGACSWWRSV